MAATNSRGPSSNTRDVGSSNATRLASSVSGSHSQILESSCVHCTDVLFGLRLRRRRRLQSHHHGNRRLQASSSSNQDNDINVQVNAAAPLTPDRLATPVSAQRRSTENEISATDGRENDGRTASLPVFSDDDRSAQLNAEALVSDTDDARVATAETGRSDRIVFRIGDERSLPATGSEISSSIAEIFKCFICFGKVTDAQLCPCCSKLVCLTCIQRWLLEQKPECPHCRTPLLVSQLVSCKFISEITEELDKVQGKATTNDIEKLCSVHQSPLSYFCSTCCTPVCSDCAILDEDHRNHSFERLIVIYGHHKKKIQQEAANLRQHLKELSLEVVAIDENIRSILKTKDESLIELQVAYACMQKRLEEQLKCKLLALSTQKGSLTKEMELAETVLHELDNQLNNIPKSDLIAQEPMLCRMLQDIRNRTFLEAQQTPTSTDLISEVVPRYEHGELVIKKFKSHLTKAKPQDFHCNRDSEVDNVTDVSKEVIYSKTLFASGVSWRLKVYPNGSAASKGKHISVFMEMLEGNTEPSTYEYGIEMLHRSHPHQSILRSFSSDFEVGACWGCHQFFQIDLLEKEGYLLPEEDVITFRFHVKALTFSQQCRDLKRALAEVQIERNDILAQLTAVRRAFVATIWQCRHNKSNRPLHSGRHASLILEEMDNALAISEPSRRQLNPNRTHMNERDQNQNFAKPYNRQGQGKHSQQNLIHATCMSGRVNQMGLSKPREYNVVEEPVVTLKDYVGDVSQNGNLELMTSEENFPPRIPSNCTVHGSSKQKCEAWLRTRDECQVSLSSARMHRKLKSKRLQKYWMHHSAGFHCNFMKENTYVASNEEPLACNNINQDGIVKLDRAHSASSVGSVEPRDSSKDDSDATKESPEHLPSARTECSGNEMVHPSDSLCGDNLLQR